LEYPLKRLLARNEFDIQCIILGKICTARVLNREHLAASLAHAHVRLFVRPNQLLGSMLFPIIREYLQSR
jgi:hypothetical protein